MPSTPESGPTLAPRSTALAQFETALTHTAAGTREADTKLVAAVRNADAAGESSAVLRLLAERPRVVLRLDQAVRRTHEYPCGHAAQTRRGETATSSPSADASPLGVALASAHPDGRVRERAVRRILELLSRRSSPVELLPFLVLRTSDWARPVRDRSRAALAVLLHEAPEQLLPGVVPIVVLTDQRRRGGFARQQVLAALLTLPGSGIFDQLLASPNARLRRFGLEASLPGRRLPLRTLVTITARDSDRRCRGLAAEAAVREAVWTEQLDLLRQLAASRYREVRVLALIGLIRSGRAAEAAEQLDDPSTLVRAVARDAIRRIGGDALGHYRTAVQSAAVTPGTVAGLAETDRTPDANLLVPLLDHPQSPIRAAAVRGLRTLDSVPVERIVPLLRDPSTKVIREAAAALRSRIDQLPAGLADALLADRDRVAVRRAGYRLLHNADLIQRLRTSLTHAADPDPRLAKWAAGDAAAAVQSIHPSPWHTRAVPAFNPTPGEKHVLLALAEAATTVPYRTRQLLQERFAPTAPATELLRVRYGPHPDTKNPLMDLEATFTADDPFQAVALMREVLLTILPHAAGPAADWPADEQWADILPDWFVQRCAPEAPARQGTAADWIAWWRGLTQRQRETEMRTDAVADWRVLDWINLFDPDGAADSRSWRWWNGGVRERGTGWVRFATDGHPYGGRPALFWLIEAAGGYDIKLP